MSQLTELTKELIKFKTTNDRPEELKRCIEFIESFFSECDVIIKKHESNSKHSLVILLKDTKEPELFLVAHCDVVPADEDMFTPVVKEGSLYGRGSVDNKGSVAVIMHLMKHYATQEKKPSIGLMITTDEEIGSENGVKYLLDLGYSSKFALVLDSGEDYEVVIKEKGLLHVKLSAKGKSAHGSRPWNGENAIDKLIQIYQDIKKKFPDTKPDDRWHKTVNLGKISGGRVVNQVPSKAEMELDMRFVSDKERDEMQNYLENLDAECKILSGGNVLDTDESNKYLQSLKASITKVIGKETKFSKEHGATDARFFAEKNIPSGLLLPQGKNIHAKDEYVKVESLDKVYDILTDFIDNNISTI